MGDTPIFDANLASARARIVMPDYLGFSVAGFNNESGKNLGSLAILGSAAADGHTVYETLQLFGEHYDAVLETPDGTGHQNIRALMTCDPISPVASVVTFSASSVTPEAINEMWEDREQINPNASSLAHRSVREVLSALDAGLARIAHKIGDNWQVNDWLKKAVLLSFRLNDNELMDYGAAGAPAFDKVSLKFDDWNAVAFRIAGIRAVPGAVVRHSAYIAKGAVLMPCFVNLGAYVGEGTMIDTWATVGSCAQIGKNVHISGGAGIGGVLEPLQANPVIIEDNCFIGARSEVAEGVIVRKGAVLSMGVFIGKNTPIVDRTNNRKVIRGEVPENAVVMMGVHPDNGLICPQIVKYRDEGTDAATALNELLRD